MLTNSLSLFQLKGGIYFLSPWIWDEQWLFWPTGYRRNDIIPVQTWPLKGLTALFGSLGVLHWHSDYHSGKSRSTDEPHLLTVPTKVLWTWVKPPEPSRWHNCYAVKNPHDLSHMRESIRQPWLGSQPTDSINRRHVRAPLWNRSLGQ